MHGGEEQSPSQSAPTCCCCAPPAIKLLNAAPAPERRSRRICRRPGDGGGGDGRKEDDERPGWGAGGLSVTAGANSSCCAGCGSSRGDEGGESCCLPPGPCCGGGEEFRPTTPVGVPGCGGGRRAGAADGAGQAAPKTGAKSHRPPAAARRMACKAPPVCPSSWRNALSSLQKHSGLLMAVSRAQQRLRASSYSPLDVSLEVSVSSQRTGLRRSEKAVGWQGMPPSAAVCPGVIGGGGDKRATDGGAATDLGPGGRGACGGGGPGVV